MCFEVGRVDGDRLVVECLSRQARHDPRKNTHIAPPLSAVVERLVWPTFSRRVTPAQPVAIKEDDAAQDSPVVDTGQAMALREIRAQPLHLSLAQPIQIAHHAPPFVRGG